MLQNARTQSGEFYPDVTPTRTSASVPASLGGIAPLPLGVGTVCSMFSWVGRLPSAPSADGFPSLFGHFAGTTRPSDSPPTFILAWWIITFSNRPARFFVSGAGGASRISRVEFPCVQGSSTNNAPSTRSPPYLSPFHCSPEKNEFPRVSAALNTSGPVRPHLPAHLCSV